LNYGIILAGGKGVRFGRDIPKQFLILGDKSVILWSAESFQATNLIDELIIATPLEYLKKTKEFFADSKIKLPVTVIAGGQTRQGSVKNVLDAKNFMPEDILLFHDAARPFVSKKIIADVISVVIERGVAGVYLPTVDTISEIENDTVKSVPLRDTLYLTQTPQGFLYKNIVAIHKFAEENNIANASDDISLAIKYGLDVGVVQGDEWNLKLTTERDFQLLTLKIENN